MFREFNKGAIDRIREDILAGKLEFDDALDDLLDDDDDEYDIESYDDHEYDYDEDEEPEEEPILIARSPSEIKLKYDHFSKLFGPYLVVRHGDFKNILDTRGPRLVLPTDASYVKHIKGTDMVVVGNLGHDRNSVFDLANAKTPNRVYDLELKAALLPPEWYLVGRLSEDLLLFYDDSRFMVYNIPMRDISACDLDKVGKYLSIRKVYKDWYVVSTNKEEMGSTEYSLINPVEGRGYRFTDGSSFEDFPQITNTNHYPEDNRFDLDTTSGKYEIRITDTICEVIRQY